MVVKGKIKSRAAASLMLTSLLDDQEKSPEESVIIHCFFLPPFLEPASTSRDSVFSLVGLAFLGQGKIKHYYQYCFQKLQKIATTAISASSENTSDFNPSVILRGCIAIAISINAENQTPDSFSQIKN